LNSYLYEGIYEIRYLLKQVSRKKRKKLKIKKAIKRRDEVEDIRRKNMAEKKFGKKKETKPEN